MKKSTSIDNLAILERSRAAYDQGVKDGLKRHYARTYPGQLGERYMEGYADGQRQRAMKQAQDEQVAKCDAVIDGMKRASAALEHRIKTLEAKNGN